MVDQQIVDQQQFIHNFWDNSNNNNMRILARNGGGIGREVLYEHLYICSFYLYMFMC